MKSQEGALNLVIQRFPNKKDVISTLFKQNNSFRAMCEEYFDCHMMINKLVNNSNKTQDMQKEYKILLSEIEDELFNIISY